MTKLEEMKAAQAAARAAAARAAAAYWAASAAYEAELKKTKEKQND